MKMKAYIAVPLLGGLMFVAGRTTAKSHDTLSQKTLENLSTAMHGEAFAYAKYSLYAKMAQENGSPEVADLFEKAANTERFEHFAEEARLARLVGTDAENLKDAIKGESYEADRMYREFEEEAAAAGDKRPRPVLKKSAVTKWAIGMPSPLLWQKWKTKRQSATDASADSSRRLQAEHTRLLMILWVKRLTISLVGLFAAIQ